MVRRKSGKAVVATSSALEVALTESLEETKAKGTTSTDKRKRKKEFAPKIK